MRFNGQTWLCVEDAREALNNRDYMLGVGAALKVAFEKTGDAHVALKHVGAELIGGLAGQFGEHNPPAIETVALEFGDDPEGSG